MFHYLGCANIAASAVLKMSTCILDASDQLGKTKIGALAIVYFNLLNDALYFGGHL
jgi:hypothetical protein